MGWGESQGVTSSIPLYGVVQLRSKSKERYLWYLVLLGGELTPLVVISSSIHFRGVLWGWVSGENIW